MKGIAINYMYSVKFSVIDVFALFQAVKEGIFKLIALTFSVFTGECMFHLVYILAKYTYPIASYKKL